MLKTIIVTEDQQYMGQRARRAGRFTIPAGTILEVRETDSVYIVVAPERLSRVGVPLSMALALPSFEDRTVLQIVDSYRRAHLEAVTQEDVEVAQQALAYLNRTAEQAIVKAVQAGLYFQPAEKAHAL